MLSLLPVDKYILQSLHHILHYLAALFFFVLFILSRKGTYQVNLKTELLFLSLDSKKPAVRALYKIQSFSTQVSSKPEHVTSVTPERGWGERKEYTGKQGKPVNHLPQGKV